MTTVDETFRTMIREELEAFFGSRSGRADGVPLVPTEHRDSEPAVDPLPGVDRYSLVPYVEHVLKEAGGGPMPCKEIAYRVYALGFQHKWPPKYPDQLVRSINSLASPSQHPRKFERVAPRVLKLR